MAGVEITVPNSTTSQSGAQIFGSSRYVSQRGGRRVQLRLDRVHLLVRDGLPETLAGHTPNPCSKDGRTIRTQPTAVVITGSNLVPLVLEEFLPKDACPHPF